MEKGIFTREQEKKLASLLDDLIKLKGLFEVVDGLVFTAIISLIDDNYINKLPDEIKVKLTEIIEAVLNDDVEKAEAVATELINALVDVPLLDEEMEGLLIGSFIRLIVSSILKWIEGKKEQPVKLKLFPR
jgi:hypothetical protein